MKKFLLWAVLFISFMVYEGLCMGSDIDFNSLPEKSKQFYNRNFKNVQIKDIEFERDDKKYEIELINEITVTFNLEGEWIEVDAESADVGLDISLLDELPAVVKNNLINKYSGDIVMMRRNINSKKGVYTFVVYESKEDTKPVRVMMNQNGEIMNRGGNSNRGGHMDADMQNRAKKDKTHGGGMGKGKKGDENMKNGKKHEK